jgi:hypothetical protein
MLLQPRTVWYQLELDSTSFTAIIGSVFMLFAKTIRFSEPEPLTQRKSKRLIEGFVCIPL